MAFVWCILQGVSVSSETVINRAWSDGFWFAVLRTKRISPYSASKGIAFKCAELIGHDRNLSTMGHRQPGGKGSE